MSGGFELLDALVDRFKLFPGVGEKAAWKMVLYLLNLPEASVADLSDKILQAARCIKKCETCGCFAQNGRCYVCGDSLRDKSVICVVQSMKDLFALERTSGYKGAYHVLAGLLSPMDGIGPEDIGVDKLRQRVCAGAVAEVIMALGPTVEGEATTAYILRLLAPVEVKITRLAYGLPIGANLEYIDDVTLHAAFEGRREI
ncbi:MAG: recombination mediator RecR [Oscillospiraceae bacterium]|jgi:recombination protein RecR|nr:recombination mediator RecR [Oscillospiraceae bacterium]